MAAEMDERRRARSTTTLGLDSVADVYDKDPWQLYEDLRAVGDPVWDEKLNAWLVSTHAKQRALGPLDEDVYRFPFIPVAGEPIPLDLDEKAWLDFIGFGSRSMPLMITGEKHRAHHRWWIDAFSPRVLDGWAEKYVRPAAHAEIDRIIGQGHADLAADYADRVSPRVMCAVLGLPLDDAWIDRFTEKTTLWVSLNAAARSVQHADDLPDGFLDASLAATRECQEMMRTFVEARRDGTGDDFISMVWRQADDLFGPDSDQCAEVTAWAIVAFLGGAETTSSSAASGLYYLLAYQPELVETLRAGGAAAVQSFVEEALRLTGPVDMRARIAWQDTEIEGVRIAEGEHVLSLIAGANRDPERFACPHMIDLDRRQPRTHLAFSTGPRTCPGHALARLQLEVIVSVALDRLQDLRLDPDSEPASWRSNYVMRRFTPVNVLFTPGGPTSSTVG